MQFHKSLKPHEGCLIHDQDDFQFFLPHEGQDFAFNGYLPKENNELRKKIRSLELYAKGTGQTQIFMEAPYRNQKIMGILTAVCEGNTYLCIAQNITGENEYIKTKSIATWKSEKKKLDDTPCLFLLNKI